MLRIEPKPIALRRTDLVLPDQLAGRRVERLHRVHGVGEEHDAVVDERRRLIRARPRSSPTPTRAADPSTLSRVICVSGLWLHAW